MPLTFPPALIGRPQGCYINTDTAFKRLSSLHKELNRKSGRESLVAAPIIEVGGGMAVQGLGLVNKDKMRPFPAATLVCLHSMPSLQVLFEEDTYPELVVFWDGGFGLETNFLLS